MKLIMIAGASAFLKNMPDVLDHCLGLNIDCSEKIQTACKLVMDDAEKRQKECNKAQEVNADLFCSKGHPTFSDAPPGCADEGACAGDCKEKFKDWTEFDFWFGPSSQQFGETYTDKDDCATCRDICEGHQYDCRVGCCSENVQEEFDSTEKKADAEAEAYWVACNTDGNDHLTRDEVQGCIMDHMEILEKFEGHHVEGFIDCMAKSYDTDGNQKIDKNEFESGYGKHYLQCMKEMLLNVTEERKAEMKGDKKEKKAESFLAHQF